MDLKNNHPTPLYHLIYIVLRDKILRGIYPKGSNIPSENELVKEYSVSRITARRSLENLSRDGLVSRHRGRGTIVTYDMPVTAAKSGGMEDLMENLLMIAQETKVKILNFSYIEADAELKSVFQLQEGDNHTLQKTVRVRYQNKAPFSYVVAHVPEEIGRCYKKKDLSHISLQPIDGKLLALDLKSNTSLKSMNLRGNKFGQSGWIEIFNGIKENDNC
mgnify:CR=1 FL=1